jgi:hypothetical protein
VGTYRHRHGAIHGCRDGFVDRCRHRHRAVNGGRHRHRAVNGGRHRDRAVNGGRHRLVDGGWHRHRAVNGDLAYQQQQQQQQQQTLLTELSLLREDGWQSTVIRPRANISLPPQPQC